MLHYAVTIEDLAELLQDSRALVVGCYSDWCPASSQSKPVFERLSMDPDALIRFCKIRTDMSPELSSALRVQSIPSFYFFASGRLVDVVHGSVPEQTLVQWLAQSLARVDEDPSERLSEPVT
jgi:thioredoxin-like negative regulator of GroEL